MVKAQTLLANYSFNSSTAYPVSPDFVYSDVTSTISSTDSFQTYSGTATGSSSFTNNTTAGNALAFANSSGQINF